MRSTIWLLVTIILSMNWCAVQRDKSVKKGTGHDICHLLEGRITVWQQDDFDLLLQEVNLGLCAKSRCSCSGVFLAGASGKIEGRSLLGY